MWGQPVVYKWISIHEHCIFSLLFDKSGGSKSFVDTNVATRILWLDTTVLKNDDVAAIKFSVAPVRLVAINGTLSWSTMYTVLMYKSRIIFC
jgi:hypothetical protein